MSENETTTKLLAAIKEVIAYLEEGYISEECAEDPDPDCWSCRAIKVRSELQAIANTAQALAEDDYGA